MSEEQAEDRNILSSTEPLTEASSLPPDPAMSSSLRFGSRIKNLPLQSGSDTQSNAATTAVESPDNAYKLIGPSPRARTDDLSPSSLLWPDERTAQELLQTVLTNVGTVQHLVDPRSISDHLADVYDQGPPQRIFGDMRMIELLLVFAIGELLQGIIADGATLPGAAYFQAGIGSLPGVSDLRAAGTVAVEIMALAAFYLQCADCKEDAYIYAGMGMRFAVSIGMARGPTSDSFKRSQKVHHCRLWWTVRLAAATGNPFGINDDVISAEQPEDWPGFPPAAALRVNIKLAEITGNIMQIKAFLKSTQEMLTVLHNIGNSMPKEYAIDFSKPIVVPSRTSATLHLMFYQVSSKISSLLSFYPVSPYSTGAFLGTNACCAANTASCRASTVATHRRTQSAGAGIHSPKAKFGFFDLDALFSAAFVFVLGETMDLEGETSARGIARSASLMQYLGAVGNKVAVKRLMDIEQMCTHLNIAVEESISEAMQQTPSGDEAGQQLNQEAHEAVIVSQGQKYSSEYTKTPESRLGSGGYGAEGLGLMSLWSEDIDFLIDFDGNDLNLDGTIETDWGEFERTILH
ncbi:fungal specific transcription factor domain-containing protein [Sarocladium implicatum]|nr:fungal specific transcription factor domain-containing protein [Sarocladium implicatum]